MPAAWRITTERKFPLRSLREPGRPAFAWRPMKRFVLWGGAVLAFAVRVCGWDYEGHRLINELALASLPTNFPAFVREPANAERIAFLAGEADRWRNTSELGLKHANNPDHFLDLEDLPALGLSVSNVSAFRHEFVAQVALARAKDPAKFPPTDPVVDQDRTKWLPGFLPWRITEDYGRLKSAFSYLRTFEQFGGTAEEIANARGNVVYLMGLMGHFIGDTVQPLHVTRSYNGWVMANPNGYTTNRTFHAWIDGGYLRKVGLDRAALVARINPAKSVWERTPGANRDNLFPLALGFVAQQAPHVEALYQMEKDGRLSGNGERGLEGRDFLGRQMLLGGQMLGDLWLTAWQTAPVDGYLRSQLVLRQTGGVPPK
jgi:hypothetical protein